MKERKIILMLLVILAILISPCGKIEAKDNELLELIISEAEKGNVKLQYYLGIMYLKGEGLNQNYDQAISWFKKAADQGDSSSQYQLGLIYEKGLGVKKDIKKAMDWYKKAASGNEVDKDFSFFNFNDFTQIKKRLAVQNMNKAEEIYEIVASNLMDRKVEKMDLTMILFLTLADLRDPVDDKSLLFELDLTGDNYLLSKKGKVLVHSNYRLEGNDYSDKSFFKQMEQVPYRETINNLELSPRVSAFNYLIYTTDQKGFIIFFSRITNLSWYYVTQVQIW